MFAIRQIYKNAPAMIPIPEAFRHGYVEVILLVQEHTKSIPENELKNILNATENGCEKVFFLLTQLSEDFLLEGRNQLPLQIRDNF